MISKIKVFLQKNLWLPPVVLGFLLRIATLTRSSVWHDEGYTMWLVQYNPLEIIARDIRDVHPPGYYLILKPWVALFGNSAFSARFFSLIFSVGIIYLVFLIAKRLFDERAAFISALLVALSPFMVRFGQEARMYGVVAFFTTLATYYLLRFIQEKNKRDLIFYAIAMVFAVYNQYYAFFVVISHWIIMGIATKGFFLFRWSESFKKKEGLFNWGWWVSNLAILLAYLPWFPIAYKQVTRVSGSYWIKPEWITEKTIPSNVLQFATYTHFDKVYSWNTIGPILYWVTAGVLILGGLYLLRNKELRGKVASLYVFGYIPMILVFTLSKLRTPVYQDRYFPFSAIAIFMIWGVAISKIQNKLIRHMMVGIALLTLLVGNFFMVTSVNHKMKQLSVEVKRQMQPGDLVLSGELYTYLDGCFYFGYNEMKLLSNKVDGFGETSLFWDKQDKYLVNPNDKEALPKRFWLVGKSGKDYFDETKWPGRDSVTYFEQGGLKAVLYTR